MRVLFVCCVIQTSLLLIFLWVTHGIEGRRMMMMIKEEQDDLELEKQQLLQVLNKPPAVTSFQYEDGDIMDCIDINKQPAFDHPLLRNHTIQMEPSSWMKRKLAVLLDQVKSSADSGARGARMKSRGGVDCPEGTVPILRSSTTNKPPLLPLSDQPQQNHHYATAGTDGGKFYGATAFINVYNQTVAQNQFSGAGVWLSNTINDQPNGIHYGWQVNPTLYGDSQTRTVAMWTVDKEGKTGCYNLRCPGYVQVSPKHPLGDPILRQSAYSGEQFSMVVLIVKDKKTGNWLVVEDMDDAGQVVLGYWPKELFTRLAESAGQVQFGGEAYSPPNEPFPSMGSGHFEPPDFQKTSYVSHIQFVDSDAKPFDPTNVPMTTSTDCPNVYKVQYLGFVDDSRHFSAQFGGPAGATSC